MKKISLTIFFLPFLLIVFPSYASAAIAFDASTVGASPTRGATSETYSHAVGSGSDRYLVVAIARNDDTTTAPDDITSVTYNGVAMTRLVALDGNGDGRFLYSYLYGLANPTPGSHNVVVSLTGSTGSRAYSITASYTGVKQTGQPDATASVTASTGNAVSTTLTTVADNSWIIAGAADNNPPYTGSGVLTTRGGSTAASSLLDSNGVLTPAGAKTVSITATGRNSLVAVSLAPTPLGTVNKLAKFITAFSIGDALLSDDGSNTILTSGNLLLQVGSIIDSAVSGVLNFGTATTTTMTFGRSGQNMIINSKVGVGISTPTAMFHVNGDLFANLINIAANGLGIDTLTTGALSIGSTTANAINIGHTGATTTVSGPLTTGSITVGNVVTSSNCNSSSSPASCGSAPAGSVAMATGVSTLVVNTTAVTANSQIFIIEDSSLGSRLGITCNTGTNRDYSINARTVGTSFTIKSSANPTGNKACLSYFIVN